MKVSEVIRKAMSREILWIDAARILGISDRQMRRWKERYEAEGADGLRDYRQGKVPANRIAEATVARVVALYRDSYAGFNVQHFWEQLPEHGIEVSYSWTKMVLRDAGLVSRGSKRKRYRRRREREPMPGMMVHLDGSKHRWFQSEDGGQQDLLAFVDDATGELLFPLFVPEESTHTVLLVLRELVQHRGTFGRLYVDRASHFVYTADAKDGPDRTKKTQVERVLDELGIELVCEHRHKNRWMVPHDFLGAMLRNADALRAGVHGGRQETWVCFRRARAVCRIARDRRERGDAGRARGRGGQAWRRAVSPGRRLASNGLRFHPEEKRARCERSRAAR